MSESRELETLCVDDNEVWGRRGGFRCLGGAAPSVAERSGHSHRDAVARERRTGAGCRFVWWRGFWLIRSIGDIGLRDVRGDWRPSRARVRVRGTADTRITRDD